MRSTSLVPILSLSAVCVFSQPKLDVLVISGGHSYDTVQFNTMWKSYPQFACTFKVLPVGNEIFEDVSAWNHDVLVFFNQQDPNEKFTDKQKANFLSLLDRGVGMIVLHHAVASYPDWPEFEKMAGVKYISRNFHTGDSLSVAKTYVTHDLKVLDAAHPIMAGWPSTYTLRDEGYRKMRFAPDNRLLLRTHNVDADTPAAWTRHARNSRVFATPLGHGPDRKDSPNIFTDAHFKAMMKNAVLWTAPCASALPSSECGTSIAPAEPGREARQARREAGSHQYSWWLARGSLWDAAGRKSLTR